MGRGRHAQVFGQRCGDLATRWRSQPLVLVSVPENLVILTLTALTEVSRSHKLSFSFHAPSWLRVYDIYGGYRYFSPGASETLLGQVYARRWQGLGGGDTGHSGPQPLQGYCCSVAQSCPTLCNPMDCSMPDSSVLHHHPEFAQMHVH